MGLFGYGKRDFEKNTKKFADALNTLTQRVSSDESAKELTAKAIDSLQKTVYPEGADKKKAESIDKKIGELIDEMSKDADKASYFSYKAHAEILNDWLMDARKAGRIKDEESLIAKEEYLIAEASYKEISEKADAIEKELIELRERISVSTDTATKNQLMAKSAQLKKRLDALWTNMKVTNEEFMDKYEKYDRISNPFYTETPKPTDEEYKEIKQALGID